ncbi:MAG: zf-HC2 domain-containing protein [Acidimicrobiia bacterium]
MNWLAHRRMQRAVTAFVDGELDASTAAAVETHLRDCWDCSGDAELARMVKASLRNLAHRDRDALAAVRLRRFATGLSN